MGLLRVLALALLLTDLRELAASVASDDVASVCVRTMNSATNGFILKMTQKSEQRIQSVARRLNRLDPKLAQQFLAIHNVDWVEQTADRFLLLKSQQLLYTLDYHIPERGGQLLNENQVRALAIQNPEWPARWPQLGASANLTDAILEAVTQFYVNALVFELQQLAWELYYLWGVRALGELPAQDFLNQSSYRTLAAFAFNELKTFDLFEYSLSPEKFRLVREVAHDWQPSRIPSWRDLPDIERLTEHLKQRLSCCRSRPGCRRCPINRK